MKKLLLASALAFTVTSHAGVKQEVKFKRGESSTQISGGVIRGERDQYSLGAGKDQYLTVTLTSAESNAVLEIYSPGYKADADGEVKGARLTGASETTRYVGQLPAKGQYLIVIGGTRGNADYKLSVSITSDAPRPTPSHNSSASEVRPAPADTTSRVFAGYFPAPGTYKCATSAGFDSIELTPKGQFLEVAFLVDRGKPHLFMASAGRLSATGPATLFSAEWIIAPAAVVLGDRRWKRATGLSAVYLIRERDKYSFDRLSKRSQDLEGKWDNSQGSVQTCEVYNIPSTINKFDLPAEFFR